jgi:hypothetical protein
MTTGKRFGAESPDLQHRKDRTPRCRRVEAKETPINHTSGRDLWKSLLIFELCKRTRLNAETL